jgi:hypothetical protein
MKISSLIVIGALLGSFENVEAISIT